MLSRREYAQLAARADDPAGALRITLTLLEQALLTRTSGNGAGPPALAPMDAAAARHLIRLSHALVDRLDSMATSGSGTGCV